MYKALMNYKFLLPLGFSSLCSLLSTTLSLCNFLSSIFLVRSHSSKLLETLRSPWKLNLRQGRIQDPEGEALIKVSHLAITPRNTKRQKASYFLTNSHTGCSVVTFGAFLHSRLHQLTMAEGLRSKGNNDKLDDYFARRQNPARTF